MNSTRSSSTNPAFAATHALPSRPRLSGSKLAPAAQSPRRAGKRVSATVSMQATPALSVPSVPAAASSHVVSAGRCFGGRGGTCDHEQVKTVATPAALNSHLRAQAASGQITVLSCHSKSCASCRATMPKFYKLAAAYTQTSAPVRFIEMDYASNDEFCHSILGVNNLPFFAVFKGTEYVSGSAMGWKSVTSKLSSQIECNIASVPAMSA